MLDDVCSGVCVWIGLLTWPNLVPVTHISTINDPTEFRIPEKLVETNVI